MRKTGKGSWGLAVAVVSFALCASAPSALAAGSAKISGTVTKVGGIEPIEGIEVCADELNAEFNGELEGPPEHCAKTNSSGDYTISEIPKGKYEIEFSASGLNYVTQYYKGKPSLATGEIVTVLEGEDREEINAQLQVGGKISGTVMNASKADLEDIEVTVYEAGSEHPVAYAMTEAQGAYTIVGLAGGSYKVGFSPAFEKKLNYVPQFYKDKPSFAAAELVKVETEKTTEDIDAELQPGGEIEGTVTAASTNTALPNTEVAVLGPNETVEGLTITEANGHYTILGLASGSYEVGFANPRYITQYYNDQPSFASSNPVTVLQGGTTSQINAALVLRAPTNTAAPVASGTPASGQTLSCSTGTWTGSPKPTYTFAWLRDGVAIPGALASTYVVAAADVGNGLTCKVTATNKNGSVAAISNTLIVPVPVVGPSKPVITLKTSKLLVSGGSVRVLVSCAVATCTGTIELLEQVASKHVKGNHKTSRTRTIVLGKGAYTLGAGHSVTVVIHLSSTVKRTLAKARHHRLSVKLLASVFGGTSAERSILLSQPPAKHKRKRR